MPYKLSAYAIKIKNACAKENIGTLWNFKKHLHQNPPKLHKVPAPGPSGTSPSIFSAKTLQTLTRSLHRNLPEPHHASSPIDPPESHQVAAPKPKYLHRNLLPALETSGTSQGICTGTLRNLRRYLHPPEPHPQQVSSPEPSGTRSICTGTLRNLVRNLVLKLHRIAPELIWAEDPIAKFYCWGKNS